MLGSLSSWKPNRCFFRWLVYSEFRGLSLILTVLFYMVNVIETSSIVHKILLKSNFFTKLSLISQNGRFWFIYSCHNFETFAPHQKFLLIWGEYIDEDRCKHSLLLSKNYKSITIDILKNTLGHFNLTFGYLVFFYLLALLLPGAATP